MSSGVLSQPDEKPSLSSSTNQITASRSPPSKAISSARPSSNQDSSTLKSRAKANPLGDDLRGDTGAPALATTVPAGAEGSSVSGRMSEKEKQQLPRTSKRRKARTLLRRWRSMSQKYTWLNPLVFCLLVMVAYLVNPTERNPVHRALFLSYPIEVDEDADDLAFGKALGTNHTETDTLPINTPKPTVTLYGKGPADLAFVAFYTIFLTFTREFIMQQLLRPIARRYGIRSRGKQARFMEQAYTAIYFGILGPAGLYVMRYQSPLWYFDTTAMYAGFPHTRHRAAFKAYYLVEASYWLQQMGVLLLMLEKPRKDFRELVAHHIITLTLIGLSYRFHFMYMGLAVYITHDVSDFFLATSKILNYTSSPLLTPFFVTFIACWTYMRHYLNLRILYSVLTTFASVGPFALDWDAGQYKCRVSQVGVFVLLASLQAINIFWLVLILRIAWRFVKAGLGLGKGGEGEGDEDGGIRDIRSEDEDEDDDDEEEGEDDKNGNGNGEERDGAENGAVVADQGVKKEDKRGNVNGNGNGNLNGAVATGTSPGPATRSSGNGNGTPRQRRA